MNSTARFDRYSYLLAVAIGLLVFLVYLPSLQNGFVNWDDDIYIYDNLQIRAVDLNFFRWAFLEFHAANWHPLTWISHAIDYSFWGLSPAGHHFTNNVIHAINTGVVVLFVLSLMSAAARSSAKMPRGLPGKRGMYVSAAAAGLLFGLHPIHVESVAWISERKDLLCGLFYLLGLLSYLKYVGTAANGKYRARILNGYYIAAVVCLICALLSKPMAVTFPLVLLLLDWYPLRRIDSVRTLGIAFVEKIPLFLLSIAASLIAIFAQASEDAIASLEYASLPMRLQVSANALISYLHKILIPAHLIPFYPYPAHGQGFSLQSLVSFLLIILVTVGAVIAARKSRILITAWLYFIVTLLPVIGLLQVGYQSMADRYTYLPSLGPFVLAGVTISRFSEKLVHAEGKVILKACGGALAALIFALLAYKTVSQISIWKDSMTLWNYEIEQESVESAVAYYHRGIAFKDAGDFARAVDDYTRAIALKPDYYEAFNNRATIHDEQGRYEAAINDYTAALRIRPHYLIYYNRAMLYAISGELGKAIDDFNRSIELNAKAANSYLNRGYVYLKLTDPGNARNDFRMGCNLGNEKACRAMDTLSALGT